MPLDGGMTARLDALRQRARVRRTASWRDRREKLRALRRVFIERRKVIHFTNEALPFGGIGPNHIGRSHGEAGFEAFSNLRPVMRTASA